MSDRLPQLVADFKAAGLGQWLRSEQDERALLAGCTFDASKGERVVEFFARFLRHFKGQWADKPFILQDWQRDDIVMPLFSWVREDGRRRFSSADIWVAKKNGKSALASGLGLYGLLADGEAGAEIYAAACDREQAGIVYGVAADMVQASPALRKRLDVRRASKTIRQGTSSWFRALSAEHATAQGLNAHFVIIDEIHAFNERGRSLFRALYYGGRARTQKMRIVISTAGDDDTSVAWEQWEYAHDVLDNKIEDTSSFVYIAEPDKADEWTDPITWRKANPSMGVIFQEEMMVEDCAQARNQPRRKADFERYLLNRWVSSASPWLNMDKWHAGAREIDLDEFEGLPCVGGLDLAAKIDLAAFVLAFPDEEGNITLYPWFFMPEDRLDDKDLLTKGGADYAPWIRDGHVITTPGARTNHAYIERVMVKAQERFDLQAVVFDDWNIGNLDNRMEDEYGLEMIECPPGVKSLNDPSKTLEALMMDGKLWHPGNPCFDWMAANVCVNPDINTNIRPIKPKAKSGKKIDGIVAAIMAMGRVDTIESSEATITVLA